VKRQAAVFVTVPVGGAVEEFRARHHPRAIARKLPPHVTILPPFTRVVDEDEMLGSELARHFAASPSFEAELVGVRKFRRHVWLAPVPTERFVELLTSARDRFPHLVRDGDRDPVPHLTIAEIGKGESTVRVAELAEEELEPLLPIRFDVQEVGLYEVRRDGWHEVRRFALG
jgi:2'-5' RNA ligase